MRNALGRRKEGRREEGKEKEKEGWEGDLSGVETVRVCYGESELEVKKIG